jgi:hypothetical protein
VKSGVSFKTTLKVTTGYAEIRASTVNTFQQRFQCVKFAHHFVETLQSLEKQCSLVWQSALKIRVSVVRFRPWPPRIQHRSSNTLYGVLLCGERFSPASRPCHLAATLLRGQQ